MSDIDAYVQHTMKTNNMSPRRRAKVSVQAIAERVCIEEGLPLGSFLPVPIEWEHRVPEAAPSITSARIQSASLMPYVDEAHGVYPIEIEEPATINYVPDPVLDGDGTHDEIAVELMKESFNALWHEDEDLADKKFGDFWERGEK